MTLPRESDSRQGLVDWPDGRDWTCCTCGAVHPENTALASCECGGTLTRVNRAYLLPGAERIDVVIEYSGGIDQ